METDRLQDDDWAVPEFRLTSYRERSLDYCVCIPVINEGDKIRRQLGRMREAGVHEIADIYILDGGSTDGSLADDFLRSHHVSALLVKTGPGKLSAQLRMGYAFALRAGYRGIVTIDGNDKDGMEAIAGIIERMRARVDFVQGSRYQPGGQALNTPLVRGLASRLIHAPVLSVAAGFHYTDTTNGFRGYSRRLLLDPRVRPFRCVRDIRIAGLSNGACSPPGFPRGRVPGCTSLSCDRQGTHQDIELPRKLAADVHPAARGEGCLQSVGNCAATIVVRVLC